MSSWRVDGQPDHSRSCQLLAQPVCNQTPAPSAYSATSDSADAQYSSGRAAFPHPVDCLSSGEAGRVPLRDSICRRESATCIFSCLLPLHAQVAMCAGSFARSVRWDALSLLSAHRWWWWRWLHRTQPYIYCEEARSTLLNCLNRHACTCASGYEHMLFYHPRKHSG